MSLFSIAPHTVPSPPVSVLSFGDVIVWEEPLAPNGYITGYEIQFLIPDMQFSVIQSRSRQGTFYVITDDNHLENTFFRVRIDFEVASFSGGGTKFKLGGLTTG